MKTTELQIKSEILKAVDEMGYKELTPVQEKVLPLLLAGKDAEVEAPTGTGKTACYSLPLLNGLNVNGFVNGLIICPTRELAIQVVKEIGKYAKYLPAIKTVAIYGGQNANYQIKALRNLPSIAVGTPGRILDMVARKKLDLSHVNYLVLDECDEMLDMGFIRDIDKVLSNIRGAHQTSLFSATISPEIKKISKKYLSSSFVGVKVERDLSHQHQIEQKYVIVAENDKKDAIVTLLNSVTFSRAFVFCRTKHKVMQIAKILKANTNHSITSLQGNLSQNKRDQAMQDFRAYKCDVMVATDIAARGIDVSDVDVVVNYDVPEQDEFYLHRIGRTGRVEAKGTSYTFLTKAQMFLIRKYETMSKNPLSQYVLNKEGNTVIMNKYLESLAPLLKVSKDKALEEIQEACKEYSEKEGRTILPIELAAMMLLEKSSRPIEEPEAPRSERRGRGEEATSHRASSDAINGGQRFFINLGTVDQLNDKELASFICKCAPSISEADLTDIYLKDTFSFFTTDKSKADDVLAKVDNAKYEDRDVHVKFAEPRDSFHGERKSYQKKSFGGYGHGGGYKGGSSSGQSKGHSHDDSHGSYSHGGNHRSY
jgi:ATP-dependent RNA helicase DeaD